MKRALSLSLVAGLAASLALGGRAALAQDVPSITSLASFGGAAPAAAAAREAPAQELGMFRELALPQSTADPGQRGPLAVASAVYDYGNQVLPIPSLSNRKVELTGVVHFPAQMTNTRYPVVVMLHGMHSSVAQGSTPRLAWPPVAGQVAIPNYRGYDYLGQHLASHGYIAISISANGVNAADGSSGAAWSMWARAQLVQAHLDLWRLYNSRSTAPFGTRFVGKVDLNRVGVMGHSRGGEGAAFHYLWNARQQVRYGVRAVMLLAPTDFHRAVINNVATGLILPYCDGDVSDLQGIHFFDDARYNVRGDASPKHSFLIMGANHNYYNTVWSPSSRIPGSSDDWFANIKGAISDPVFGNFAGTRRLSESQQRAGGLAYMTGFFRAYLANRSEFLPMLRGDLRPPASAASNQVFASFHAPDNTNVRRDLNRTLIGTELERNFAGGQVLTRALRPYTLIGGEYPQIRHVVGNTPQEPHTRISSYATGKRGLSQLVTGWDNTSGAYFNEVPAAFRNVSGYSALQFRACVNLADSRNSGMAAQDFAVTLFDGAGRGYTVYASQYSPALASPQGRTAGVLPKLVLNTVRIPLRAFTGVARTDIRGVQFNFVRSNRGGLLVSDVAFSQ